jgi:hypothetical protein
MKLGRVPWVAHRPITRPLHIQHNTNTRKMCTFIPRVGFEPMNPVFKWPKTVHATHHAAGHYYHNLWHKVNSIIAQKNAALHRL